MKIPNDFISFQSDALSFIFLPTGDVFEMNAGSFLLNQFRGNAKDGSVNNIYLRIYEGEQIKAVHPLLGQNSKSLISYQKNLLRFEGSFCDVSYLVDFFLVDHSWFYEVTLKCDTPVKVDLLYGQDIGLSGKENVLTNELYISQYLGHCVFKGDNGYAICSRQNMPDQSKNPYIQQGCLSHRINHYSTDGLDFFGLDYKSSDVPNALFCNLLDRNYQYEFAYAALQTETFRIEKESTCVFYGHFIEDHKDKITTLDFAKEIHEDYMKKSSFDANFIPAKTFTIKQTIGPVFHSLPLQSSLIDNLFPFQNLKEEKDGALLSFFTPEHTHVVTKEKELNVLRPHGTIIMTPPHLDEINEPLISSTHYMYGVFNSHIVLGNTNLHKFISTPRGFLNIQKNSGQRVYVKINQQYRLLGLPALFEMGMNFSRWFYQIGEDLLTITSYCSNVANKDSSVVTTNLNQVHLEIESQLHQSYDFLVTNQLSLGVNEYSVPVNGIRTENGMHFPFPGSTYKDLSYDIYTTKACSISDDRIFYEEDYAFDETFLTMQFKNQEKIHVITYASFDQKPYSKALSFQEEKAIAQSTYANIMKHFSISSDFSNEQLSIINETAWWYTHNAMIHFCMPHGLEQPGGAAWGTRDICQGPIEYFLATNQTKIVRNILKNIFSHQEVKTKEWPQWFMFDLYDMNAGECHGDVIFWPLKSISDYLLQTNDYGILEEILPYGDQKDKKETLFSHIKEAIFLIKDTRFIKDTGLITYAGGDWDDTLQPAHTELKDKLISVWTQALAYQTFSLLSKAFLPYDKDFATEMKEYANKTKQAFLSYGIKDSVISGFLKWDDSIEYLLHPSDTQTGIHYRLLPQTRSIIAELIDKEQASQNIALIQENLACPDGVRLMDSPASYDGGISHLFKRAEQAANIGREISLQYTHAHIRYIEAMAKYGEAQKAWDGLFQINPILIDKTVPNASLRQSNLYFSSSDGDFFDRYQYHEEFHRLKTGDIAVKGGWRLYSSGPGIYMHQLISHILGIRFQPDSITIDPVLPTNLPSFVFQLECFGKRCKFHYEKSKSKTLQIFRNGVELKADKAKNNYREAGLVLTKETFLASDEDTYLILY